MSDLLPPSQDGPGGPSVSRGSFAPSWRTQQRRASVTLRHDADADDAGSLMDPATKSLSDALRVTYRFVLIAVALLGVFYVLSGFRRVYEGERGLRLLFGRVVADDIGPGFRPSWPEPFGELVKVRTGAQSIALDDEFFPSLTAEEKKQFKDNPASLGTGGYDKLNPETDGSLITGDGNLAHTRWAITYHREDPKRVAEQIDPDYERSIVVAACRRGVVRAVASVSIDELLKNTPDETRTGDWRTVENRAREIAQDTLNKMDSGLEIDILSMTAKIPPRRVISAFNEVQSSFSDRKKTIDEAATDRTNTLVATAGEAAEHILAQINEYEKAIELKDHAHAAQIMDRIDSLMIGKPVTINGEEVQPSIYGTVATLLSKAQSDRSTYVSNLQGEVARFNAKLDSYNQNPVVLLNSEWADAYSAVMGRQYMQGMMLPQLNSSGKVVITIGRDPQIAKDIQQGISKQKAEEAERIRIQNAERARREGKVESTIERRGN